MPKINYFSKHDVQALHFLEFNSGLCRNKASFHKISIPKCRKNQLSCLNFPLLANTIIAQGGKKQKERKRSYGKQEVQNRMQ